MIILYTCLLINRFWSSQKSRFTFYIQTIESRSDKFQDYCVVSHISLIKYIHSIDYYNNKSKHVVVFFFFFYYVSLSLSFIIIIYRGLYIFCARVLFFSNKSVLNHLLYKQNQNELQMFYTVDCFVFNLRTF